MRNRIKLLCAGLAALFVFTGCKTVNDGVSDIGSGISDLTGDLSSGMSDLESNVSSELSEAGSDLSSDLSREETDRSDMESSHPESSTSSESAPTSGALSGETSEEASQTAASTPAYDLASLDNTKQGWGQGVQFDDKNRPIAAVSYQEKYGKYDAYFIGEDSPTIYLTFDNGYENGYTAPILDALKEKGVQAVFFCTLSYIKSQPELIQRMIDEGHIVGNHSDKHPCFPEVSIERREQEVLNVHQYMLDNYNYTMTLFRAPAGEFSEQTLAQTQELGYKTVFWSYAYKDWDPNNQMGPENALPKITKALHPGAIYLLHAVSPDNAAILGDFIDNAREVGYNFALFQ